MKMNRIFHLFFILFFAAPFYAGAQESESTISVKAELNKAFITIGEPVEYRVTIKSSGDIKILSDIPSPSKQIFKIKETLPFEEVEDNGSKITGKKFVLTAFKLGDYILPSVKVDYLEKGKEPASIESEKIFLKVKSIAEGEEKEDIRGIKSVLLLPRQVVIWIFIVLLLVLIILSPFLYKIIKKSRAALQTLAKKVTPKEQALKELHALYDSDLLKRGLVKNYYLKFSEIFCHFLSETYQIHALEGTTYEIDLLLKEKESSNDRRKKVRELLEFSDLAKFAKYLPSDLEVAKMNREAESFVQETAEKVEEVSDGV
jgi:hypothetical protein